MVAPSRRNCEKLIPAQGGWGELRAGPAAPQPSVPKLGMGMGMGRSWLGSEGSVGLGTPQSCLSIHFPWKHQE